MMRIGLGYDVHRLVPNRPLVLGGVVIPHEFGLEGHSDADVLTHAVCDAILGAAALGDIGQHFPASDHAYKGASSLVLLSKTVTLAVRAGFAVRQIDATIIAQSPRIGPFRDQMRANLSSQIGIPIGMTSVKATTTEGLGYLGRREGVAALCIAQLKTCPSP